VSEPIGTSWLKDEDWDYEFTCSCGCHLYQGLDRDYPVKMCVQCNKIRG